MQVFIETIDRETITTWYEAPLNLIMYVSSLGANTVILEVKFLDFETFRFATHSHTLFFHPDKEKWCIKLTT
jgi:hypothetical protein